MSVIVRDPFNLVADTKMPFIAAALNPMIVSQQFRQCLPLFSELYEIRVIRHKLGRRCLIEYDLNVEQQRITVLGKVRAKGTDTKSYELARSLWKNGFSANSKDGISIPEPLGIVPAFQMWLQRKVPGIVTTKLFPSSEGCTLARRIAEVAYKLHQTNIPPYRRHTIVDELRILHERLPQVVQIYPHWEKRIEKILQGCDRLGATIPELELKGIHRDFYPDQVLLDGTRLYLLDLDLYCAGNPGLDIGNFIAHLTEQSIRTLGSCEALVDQEIVIADRFVQLAGEVVCPAIQTYTTLTLVRHIYLSTQFLERRPFTEKILELCEHKIGGVG